MVTDDMQRPRPTPFVDAPMYASVGYSQASRLGITRQGVPQEQNRRVQDNGRADDGDSLGGRFNRRLIIGIAVVILATAYLIFLSIDAASAVYMEVEEAVASSEELGERRVRIGGSVSAGTITRTGDGLDIDFTLRDKSGSPTLPVSYRGVPPDIFGDDATVFVEGRCVNDDTFQADILLTRHPDTMEELTGSEIPASYRTSS